MFLLLSRFLIGELGGSVSWHLWQSLHRRGTFTVRLIWIFRVEDFQILLVLGLEKLIDCLEFTEAVILLFGFPFEDSFFRDALSSKAFSIILPGIDLFLIVFYLLFLTVIFFLI